MFNWGRLKLEISISDDLFSHGWKGVIREGAVFRQQLLAISSLMGGCVVLHTKQTQTPLLR